MLDEGTIFGRSCEPLKCTSNFTLSSSTKAWSRPYRLLHVWLANSRSIIDKAVLALIFQTGIAYCHRTFECAFSLDDSKELLCHHWHLHVLANLKPCSRFSCHYLIIQLSILHDWQQFVLHIMKGFFNLVHIIPMIC